MENERGEIENGNGEIHFDFKIFQISIKFYDPRKV